MSKPKPASADTEQLCVDEATLRAILLPLDRASGRIIDQVRDIGVIRRDLKMVGALFARLEKHEFDEQVEEAVWMSALVRYSRCFNESKTRTSGLDRKRFAATLGERLAAAHYFMLELRDEYLAHAGAPSVEMERASFVLLIEDDGFRPIPKQTRAAAWQSVVYTDFRAVALAAHRFAGVQFERRFRRLNPLLMRGDVQDALRRRSVRMSTVDADLELFPEGGA